MRICIFFFLFFLSFHSTIKAQKSYTDSILNLEQKLPNKEFVKAVLDIPYDKAVKNMSVFLKLTEIAIEKAKQLNDSSLLAKSYLGKATALHFTSKEDQSIELTLKAIKIFESLNEYENVAKAYLELGWKIKYRKLDNAFVYMQRGLKALELTGNKIDLVGSYNNFGVLYSLKKQNDSALYYHKKSLQLAKKLKDSIGIPFAHTHIANVLLKKKDFTNAKKHLDSSLIMRLQRNDTYGITDSYLYLGDLFYAKKEYKKAIDNFDIGYKYANRYRYFPLKKYALEYLYKSYEKNNNFKKSLSALKEFNSLKDSVLNKETNTKIAELQIEFETAKKEKLLAEQEIEIKNKDIVTLILVGSILLVSLIFWSIFTRGRLKRKQLKKEIHLKEALAKIETKNKLQEQRLEISRDLHDNIGSQLTFIISSIENLKFVSKDLGKNLQEKLSGISGFTSDTVHQLRDTIWAMNKSEISFDEFQSRLLSYIEKAKVATNNIEFDVNTNNTTHVFNAVEGMHLFRVVQEAINNSIKYANSSKIAVTFLKKENKLHITISDDGDGFDKEEINFGNGLINMESRIEKIDGKISIESKKGNGTKILIQLSI